MGSHLWLRSPEQTTSRKRSSVDNARSTTRRHSLLLKAIVWFVVRAHRGEQNEEDVIGYGRDSGGSRVRRLRRSAIANGRRVEQIGRHVRAEWRQHDRDAVWRQQDAQPVE